MWKESSSPMQALQPSLTRSPSRWDVVRRIVFRLLGSYLVLYSIPPNWPPQMLPGLSWAVSACNGFWYVVVPWFGAHLLHLEKQLPSRSSPTGDTLFGLVRIICCVVLATLLTLLWTLLDRSGRKKQVHNWVRIYIRYVLGLAMFGYGLAKVIEVQYPPLELGKMLMPIGELTPMGLLWTFMQGSRIYTLFAGLVECTGASLLFFRRTLTLGALLTAAALVNVVAMNFGYDVGVKLYSAHLLLMALFLLAPDLGRLANLLVLNRATTPKESDGEAPLGPPWVRYSRLGVKSAILGFALFGIATSNLERAKWFGKHVTQPPLYGEYLVEEFRIQDQLVPPLLTDASRWKNAIFQARGPAGRSWLSVRMMDDSWQEYRTEYNTTQNRVTISDPDGKEKKAELTYRQVAGVEQVALTGTINNLPLSMRLKRVDDSKYLLLRRNFQLLQSKGNQIFR